MLCSSNRARMPLDRWEETTCTCTGMSVMSLLQSAGDSNSVSYGNLEWPSCLYEGLDWIVNLSLLKLILKFRWRKLGIDHHNGCGVHCWIVQGSQNWCTSTSNGLQECAFPQVVKQALGSWVESSVLALLSAHQTIGLEPVVLNAVEPRQLIQGLQFNRARMKFSSQGCWCQNTTKGLLGVALHVQQSMENIKCTVVNIHVTESEH
jgi:hypothetical protein